MKPRIELVVVGAHLSGLPLNPQLVVLGGVLLRKCATAPVYRLYALAGGPPARPGMLRVAEREGASIEAEVWGLEPAAFGRFVATVPQPLTIGTVWLADGTAPKGFLAEPQGLVGAEDITHFGGWRAYLAGKTRGGTS
jgi:allophanate hydrolase